MNWSVADDDVSGQTNTTTWTDESANANSRDHMYYKITYEDANSEVISSFPVGFFNCPLPKDETRLIAAPLVLKEDSLGAMGWSGNVGWTIQTGSIGHAIKSALNADDAFANADYIEIFDHENQDTYTLYVKADGKWYEKDSKIVPKYLNYVYREDCIRVTRRNTGDDEVNIFFAGYVPHKKAESVPFYGGTDDYTYFSYPYPVETTLNDIPFLLFGAKGSTTSGSADKVEILVDGSWETLWLYYNSANHYDSNNGKWKYGGSSASASQVEVTPCKGFRYKKSENKRKGLTILVP